jgi:hypothetical protein
MGMFDYIVCKYPLPNNFDATNTTFQTKSLHCHLDKYTISSEGILLLNQKLDPTEENDEVIALIDIKYTGNISFYTFIKNDVKQWYEYSATFINGKLQNIISNK